MRIGMIAPLEMRVPPPAYGGTEMVISLLTEELVARGHEVTLFASGDSQTSARLVPGSERYLRGAGYGSPAALSLLNVLACFDTSYKFDIIHNHTCPEGMALAEYADKPVVTTIHGAMANELVTLFERYAGWYITISQSSKAQLPEKPRFAGVVYNAVDAATYPYNAGPRKDYLLYLSRMSAEKGPDLAIEAAKRLRMPLIMAGNVSDLDAEFFHERVKPHIDGELIQYVGEADQVTKRGLLSEARCLLAPVTWAEPFGLFMAESMACGTPVIALRNGSTPEVVRHGVTGYVVDSVAEMADAVANLGNIAPEACRTHVVEEFSIKRMTDRYLDAYETVLSSQPAPWQGMVAQPAIATLAGQAIEEPAFEPYGRISADN